MNILSLLHIKMHRRYSVFLQPRGNKKSNVDGMRGRSTRYAIRQIIGLAQRVYIFLHILSLTNYIRRPRYGFTYTVNPNFGRSTGEITRIILHVR